MIDNFDLIKSLFYFKEANNLFFHLQVIRRGKDHPNLPAANRTIMTYYVQSAEHLEKIKDEVISLCEMYGARAYINVTTKSMADLGKLALFRLSERVYNGDFKKIYKIFNSAAGELKGLSSRFLIDIDDHCSKHEVLDWLDHYFETSSNNRYYLFAEVPTKNGVHLITNPFNLNSFKFGFPNIDVHKNNPTILYIPKSLDNGKSN
jgi:hypothetical protein